MNYSQPNSGEGTHTLLKRVFLIGATLLVVAGLAFVLVIALPARLGGSRPVAPASRFLARAVLAFLVINAAICAAVSATNDRYQSRVTWLVALVVLEILVCERASSRSDGARS